MGRLTKSPETRQNGDSTVTRFSLAIDRKFKKDGEDIADFISCVAFGKTSDFISKYFDKGNRMALVGRIQTGSYTNREGQKIYTTDVIVEEVEFCESKKSGETKTESKQETKEDDFMTVDEDTDELPFS